ncbi:hypothetical protein ACIBCH_10970 [Amycolatopsis thailandensis]|uniref:DoxX family protein n=1 Tax=Amycolatopsis thailandensis TaxID=589330 RepID=A0A229S434_9PSEU|nr:hypothetical protein [Amycolatopsis thailandensis]OXM53656.1 hypothetical protein CFP71_20775 [Amycolatopsis thailandensis]
MQRTITRVLLVVFGLVELPVGLWPLLSPEGFYRDFPGFRTGWVAMDGPFNEHLIADFGGLNLALAAILIGAAVIGTTAVARLAALSTFLFGLPHFLYHLGHVSHFEPVDQVLIVVTTALGAVLPLVLVLIPSKRATPATP